MTEKYLVRQYRPGFVSGFTNEVCREVDYDDILNVPFCAHFKHHGFLRFTVEPYDGDELIISAHYDDGKSWVVGFALPITSKLKAPDGGLMVDNWRYQPHES